MMTIDFEDELDLPKGAPLDLVMKEELEVYSVEALKNRLLVLKTEISRTEQAIVDKGDARQSAESFFK